MLTCQRFSVKLFFPSSKQAIFGNTSNQGGLLQLPPPIFS